ncbi:hypothetical protein U1Q18_029979 [Sarracenia purpurea var. burkii]
MAEFDDEDIKLSPEKLRNGNSKVASATQPPSFSSLALLSQWWTEPYPIDTSTAHIISVDDLFGIHPLISTLANMSQHIGYGEVACRKEGTELSAKFLLNNIILEKPHGGNPSLVLV